MFSYVVIEMEENIKDRSVSVYKTGFKGKQFPPHQQAQGDSSPRGRIINKHQSFVL